MTEKRLLLYGFNKIEDILRKQNQWYLCHYEAYFSRVFVLYLASKKKCILRKNKTVLFSFNSIGRFFDLLLAPIRVFFISQKRSIDIFLTGDIVFGFWNSAFLWGKERYLVPVCHLHEVYFSKKPCFIKSKLLENFFINLTLLTASKIILSRRFPELNYFFENHRFARHKLKYVDVVIEEFPPIDFYHELGRFINNSNENKKIVLLHVGRIARDKYIFDLIQMAELLLKSHIEFELIMIGDGECRFEFEEEIKKKSLSQYIKCIGPVANKKLILYFKGCDFVVSPLMGTALREALLCNTLIVSYRNAFTNAIFQHMENAYLTPENTPQFLADGVIQLSSNADLREKFKHNLREKIHPWSVQMIPTYLKQAFE